MFDSKKFSENNRHKIRRINSRQLVKNQNFVLAFVFVFLNLFVLKNACAERVEILMSNVTTQNVKKKKKLFNLTIKIYFRKINFYASNMFRRMLIFVLVIN